MAFSAPQPRAAKAATNGGHSSPERRSTTSNSSVGAGNRPRPPRSSSPQFVANIVDQKSIMQMSQLCTEELDAKMREKSALTKHLKDLKISKMQYDNKLQKKKRDYDSAVVQTMEMDKKLQAISNGNRVMGAELTGLVSENDRLRAEVEALRADLAEASTAYERECEEIEGLKQALYATRKELANETRNRDTVQQDLRASKTAQTLMINRLDDIEKRNRALKTCVANTINH
eukprot:TRINITY_DN5565_c1_g3_i1.p1 TRINITY_DN5565_c1_g3~~TRINITY_DN5565_c1_g3_i1.p1  ORF type:complete len:247 (-),score=47.69 TRINITY_DN5565_c1_g3_i1:117-809(-)